MTGLTGALSPALALAVAIGRSRSP